MVPHIPSDSASPSKLQRPRRSLPLETKTETTESNHTAIKYHRTGQRFTAARSDPTLASTGSPISKAATQTRSLVEPAACDKRSNRPIQVGFDRFEHQEQIAPEAVRASKESVPRNRQRSDSNPDSDIDNPSTSRTWPSSSAPDTNTRATRQPCQENDNISPGMALKTARSIHDSLYMELRKTLTPRDQKGKMYVLCDPHNRMAGYKIGRTTRVFRDRIAEHQMGCDFTADVVHVSDHEIGNCARLERLVHIDLENQCAPLQCDRHNSAHKEWFQVTEEMAIGTVKRWEKFMHQEEPYGWNRRLKIVWEYLLETRSPASLDVRTLTHDARREHWERILAPPTTDEYFQAYRAYTQILLKTLYRITSDTWLCVQKFFWPISTLVYGMITLVLVRNLVAFYAFVFVLACASVNVMSHVPLSSPKRRARTPKKMDATAISMKR